MAGLYPLSRYQQFDENSQLLVGARLFLFDGGTTTPRVGYRDSSLTTEHPNPIVADAAARLPLIYLEDGFYRQRLTTASGVVVFDDDGIPVVSTSAGGTGTSVDPASTLKTRDIKIRFDDQPVDGYVRLNGRTIGSVASGATERANADTQSLYEELWSYPSVAVSGGKGASGPADFTANKALVLPDCAGRGIFGMDDMGAGARNILTAATIANPTLVGSYGGQQQVTIAQGNLPVYTLTGGASGNFTVSGTTTGNPGDHTHHMDFDTGFMSHNNSHNHPLNSIPGHGGLVIDQLVGGSSTFFGGSLAIKLVTETVAVGATDINHQHDVIGDTWGGGAHSHTYSWTGAAPNISIGSGGSGTATTNLPPVMLFMIYIRL